MSKVLLVFPYQAIKEEFLKNEKFLILDVNGLSYFNEKTLKREIFEEAGEIYYQLNELRDNLNWWVPIFERWIGKSFLFEEYRIKILKLVNYLTEVDNKYRIKKIIHFTAVPHHIISIAINIFGLKSGIDQIFFYPCIFDGRLVPILQDKNGNRHVINYKLNEINYDKLINEFIENKLKGKFPKVNTKITKLKKSYLYIYFLLLLKFIKNNFFRIQKVTTYENNMFFFKEDLFSISNYLEIIIRQKKFLKFYKKNSLSEIIFLKELKKTKKVFLIAAHYQPEATSFPEGSSYMNHIDIVNKLRKIGYRKKIYYKEHSASNMYTDLPNIFVTKVSIYKNIPYLQYLKKLNVSFIKETIPLNLDDIYSEMYLPITISGSIAIERSLVGLKTIVSGKPIFSGLPGTIDLDEIKCKDFLAKLNLKRDDGIATAARIFLKKLFDKNTIANNYGIGTGTKTNEDNHQLVKFLKNL